MSRSIRLLLDSEAARSQDGLESGGFLVGTAWERGAQVIDLLGQFLSTKRGSGWLELEGLRAKAFVAQFEPSTAIIGGWHTHPSGQIRPSPPDLTAWTDFFGFYPDCRAALIITPDAEDDRWPWAQPLIHSYMLRRHRRDGSVLVEPAAVEVA